MVPCCFSCEIRRMVTRGASRTITKTTMLKVVRSPAVWLLMVLTAKKNP